MADAAGAAGLAATQRAMLTALTGAGRPAAPDAQALVAGTPRLSAADRLAIYSRGYRSRLVGCLRETHPGLRHALGDELFDDFALEYLEAHPSRSPSLAQLGASWPEHLEATRPDAGAARRERWPDFLVDLARLERAFGEVYDGPGCEGEPIAHAGDLPSDLDATIEPVACLRLLRARFDVATYLVAVRRGDDPPLPAPAACFIALSRRDWVVSLTALDAREHAALEALLGGADLAAAARAAGVDGDTLSAYARAWADRGFVRAIARAPEPVLLSTSEVVS